VEKIIVIGASGHASVVIDCIEKQRKYEIIGIIVEQNSNTSFFDYPILGKDEDIPKIIESSPDVKFIVAIGDNITRKKVVEKIRYISPNIQFGTIIHPSAIIGKNVLIENGNVILAGVIINSNATVKSFSILNTRAIIEHDCYINEFVSVNPNAALGGNVSIGELTVICMGVSVIQNIQIGKRNIIGANSLVLKNVENDSIYYGTPAKYIRPRDIHFQYLK
jgi:sugar O-acyltransferase (sialic acid O-acetyltransferase NeuD family)